MITDRLGGMAPRKAACRREPLGELSSRLCSMGCRQCSQSNPHSPVMNTNTHASHMRYKCRLAPQLACTGCSKRSMASRRQNTKRLAKATEKAQKSTSASHQKALGARGGR